LIASDVEGTLTTGETWKGLGRYLVEVVGRRVSYGLFLFTHVPVAYLAKYGLIDRQSFKDRWIVDLARFLRGLSLDELRQMARWVVDRELWPARRDDVLRELEAHRRAGSRVVLASGTYQPILEEFAARIGAEAIGTPLEMDADDATGRILGNNTGRLKAERLRARLAGEALEIAYGDSEGDVPMLELARTPVAVHPEPPLRRLALSRAWRIVE
jgi:HAD superfamily phosphoserine phosphatase-like hydrolase